MRDLFFQLLILAVVVGSVGVGAAVADEGACQCRHCGSAVPCHKVCRLVYEEKKVEVFCWGTKEEEFCVPGPSCRGDKHCEMLCDTCGDKSSAGIQVKPKKFVWYEWIPGTSAKAYTRTKLMRGLTTVKVPSHKWVLDEMCAECVARCERPVVAPGTEVPAPPIVAANVIVLGPATVR